MFEGSNLMGIQVNTLHLFPRFYFMANTGQIIKSRTAEKYTTIPNDICKSLDLSMEEKGMMAFLLSLPADWVLYRQNIYNSLKDGKSTIDRVFRSLQKKGYILSVRVHDKQTGKFLGWNHVVYNEPAIPIKQSTDNGIHREWENPTSVNTDIGKSTPIQKKDINTNEILNTNEIIKTKPEGVLVFISLEWEMLWQGWSDYKKTEFREKYKSKQSEQIAINKLVQMSGENIDKARKIVEQSIANRWKGLFEIKTIKNDTTKSNADIYAERRAEMHKYAEQLDRLRGIRP